MKLIQATLITLALTLKAIAGPDGWLQAGLIKPEIIQQIKGELQLTPEQESQMTTLITEAKAKGDPIEQQAKQQQQTLRTMLKEPSTTADAASAQLTKTLEAEASVKQIQLRTLIALRDLLTPEQQEKAQKLSLPKVAASNATESEVMAKANRLRAAVDALGEKPTDAMSARGAEIEALLKSGDMQAADTALNQLIADSGIDEPEASSAAPDFSASEPGDTDLEVLKQRFEAVKEGAQEIVSIPLMKQFLAAKEAFESAKAAEDPIAVGRILTWAEGKLAKK